MKNFYKILFTIFFSLLFSSVYSQRFEWMEIYSSSSFTNLNQATEVFENNVYTVGEFRGSVSFGSTVLSSSGTVSSIYIANYDTLGNFRWAVKGGSDINAETFKDFEIDQYGNLYIAGLFTLTSNWGSLTLNASGTSTSSFTREGYVVKLNPLGVPQWIKGIYSPTGSFGFNDLQKLAIADSTVYFGGNLTRSISIQGSTISLTQLTSPYYNNVFIGKLDLLGNVKTLDKIANTTLSSSATVGDIKAIDNNQFVLSGIFRNAYTFGSNNRPVNASAQFSMVVAKFTGTNCDWASLSTSSSSSFSSTTTPQITICGNGDIAVAGTYRTSLSIQGQTITPTIPSANTFASYWYAARFNNAGSLIKLKGLDIFGTNLYDITETQNNEVILVGHFADSIEYNGKKTYTNGSNDLLVVNLDDRLEVNWYQTGGGGNFDYGISVASYNSPSFYVLGTFNGLSQFGSTFFTGVSGQSTTILFKMSECGSTPIPLSFIGDTNLCQGQSLRILANPSSASTFQWLNNNSILTGEVFRDLFTTISGSYSVIVNGAGCVDTSRSVLVNVGTPPSVSLSLPDTVCQSDVAFQLSGGLPLGGNYSGDGVTNNFFDPNISGIGRQRVVYTFSNGGCADSSVAFIYVKPAPAVFFLPPSNICISSTPITLTNAFPFGGVFSGTGVIGNQFDPSIAGGGPHQITYTFTDNNGCAGFKTRNINVDTVESATFASIPNLCSSTNNYTLIEGSPAGGIYQGPGVINGIFNPSLVGVGTFNLSYIISNQCDSDTAFQTVTVIPSPTVSLNSFADVCESSAAITLSGASPLGGTYSGIGVVGSQFDPSVSGAGTFTIYYDFSNSNGCASRDSSTITVNALPIISLSNDTAICDGSTVNLTANGGTNYLWSTSATTPGITVNPTITSKYYVTVSNSGNCSSIDSVTVTVNSAPTATITGVTTICDGASTNLIASGGSSYQWSNSALTSSITVSPSATTTYIVTVTDANGCSATAVETVTVIPSPTVSLNSFADVCESSAAITLSGASPLGGTYSGIGVVGSQFDPSVSGAGTFTIYYDFSNSNGCASRDSSTITVNALPIISLSNDTAICDGSTVNLTANGGTNYLWSTSATTPGITVNPTITSKYYVTVTNSGNCSSIDSVTVTVNSAPTATITGVTTICDGASTNLIASGGSSYQWSNSALTSSITVSPSATTTYIVTVTDANGCSATAVETVTVIPSPTVSLNSFADVCESSAAITLSGASPLGGTYSGIGVVGSQFDPSVSGAGTFTIYYDFSNSNGCASRDSSTITVNALPIISLSNDTAICDGSAVNLTANGGTNYLWSTSATTPGITVNPMITSKYYVTVTNSGNCSSIDSVTVSVSSLPVITVSNDTAICLGDTIRLSANSTASNYLWNTSETTSSINVSPLNSTQYIVQTVNNLNCVVSDTIKVTVNTGITLNIGPDVILDAVNNPTVTFSARAGFRNYLWQDNSTGRSITINYDPAKSGTNDTISVIAFSTTNCPSVDTAIVSYDVNTGVSLIEVKETILIYPNPVVDEVMIEFNGSHPSNRIVSVYDIEGRLVYQFESNRENAIERLNIGRQNLRKGMYTIHIKSDGETSIKKILYK